MITAIIRNKENTLVLELPHSIYDIYEKLHSIGIISTRWLVMPSCFSAWYTSIWSISSATIRFVMVVASVYRRTVPLP